MESNRSRFVNQDKLLPGKALLQIHMNSERILPKVGSKDFSPSNSWLEKKQIESLLDEHKNVLQEERVEKWGSLAGAFWNQSSKLAEVTRRVGRHFHTMGFEKNGKLFLYPEEALLLLEMNNLELLFGGVPMSLQQGYSSLLGPETGCNISEFRVYSYLVRQGYRVIRASTLPQSTRYERQIRLDQHAHGKRVHHYVKSNPSTSSQHLRPSSNNIKSEDSCNKDFAIEVLREETLSEEGNLSSKVKSEESSDKHCNNVESASNINELVDSEPHKESHQIVEGSSLHSPESPGDSVNAESKAYGIAKSLVSLGTDLLKDIIATSEGTSNTNIDLNVVLCDQIIQVLGPHVDKDVSTETLKVVAQNAARTILSHGTSKPCNQETNAPNEASTQADTQNSDAGDNIVSCLEGAEGSKDRVDCDELQSEDAHLSYPPKESNLETCTLDVTLNVQDIIERQNTQQSSLKREQKEEIDVSELVVAKKAKLLDVSDSEIEILDIVSEKTVEVIDLSGDESNSYRPHLKSKNNEAKQKAIIDVDIASEGDSDSGSSDGSAQNSSDSSIVCIETLSSNSIPQQSPYEKLLDSRRRTILNSFPCMHNKHEINLHAPDPELLPKNVTPRFSNYVINRWRLDMENKQMYQQTEQNSSFVKRTVRPFSGSSWYGQPSHPQTNFLLGGIPNDPWTLMQTLAQLLLPITNQGPQWAQSLSPWPRQQSSWPRPSWPQQPYFKPHDRWQQRPRGYRHHSPRFTRPYRSRASSSPRPFVQNLPRHRENFPNQPTSNMESAVSFTGQGRPQRSHCRDDNYIQFHENRGSTLLSQRVPQSNLPVLEEAVSPISKTSQNSCTKMRRRKQSPPRLFKGSSRYFKPPRKYHHMRKLMEENKSVTPTPTNINVENVVTMKKETSSSEDSSSSQDEDEEHKGNDADDNDSHSDDSDASRIPLLQPDYCSNFESVCKNLQVIQRMDTKLLKSLHFSPVLKVCFNVFLPTASFRKGSPPSPNYHLCIMDVNDPVPSAGMVSSLALKLDDGVPILFAIVHPDSITFLQFNDVSIPFQPIDL